MLRLLFKFIVVVGVVCGGGFLGWKMLQVEPPMQRAERALVGNNVSEAQVLLRGVIKTEPRNARAHLLLAETQLASSDWLSAEREAKILRTLGYDRTVVSPILVQAYAMQGRFQDILTDIPAIAARPDEQAMNLVLRSIALVGLKDVKQAEGLVQAAGKLSPDDFLVHLQRARLAVLRKDAGVAVQEADAALALRPGSTQALQARGEALLLRSDTAGAIEALDQAVALMPLSQDLRLARAWMYISLGMDRQAAADVGVVFDLTSTNATAQYYNAILMFRSQQYADANVEFDKLGGVQDQFPRTHFYKAQIALALRNRKSALESLDRLLKLLPGDPEGTRLAAEVELLQERPERALALLQPATVAASRDAAAIDLQGRALFMLGRMNEAVVSFRRAADIAPDNKLYASHLAAAQTRFGSPPATGPATGPRSLAPMP